MIVSKKLILNPVAWAIAVLLLGLLIDLAFALVTDLFYGPGAASALSVLQYIAACWVVHDSARKGIYFPGDMTFLCFLICFPAYLFESRGVKGMLLLIVIVLVLTVYSWITLTIEDLLYTWRFA